MGKKFKVKEFEFKEDFENYILFQKKFLGDTFNNEYEIFFRENFKLKQNEDLFIIYLNNIIVGEIFIQIKNNFCKIDRIEVLEEYRNQNLGTNSLYYLFGLYKDFDFYVDVNIDNKGAIKLYENLGFRKYNKTSNLVQYYLSKTKKVA